MLSRWVDGIPSICLEKVVICIGSRKGSRRGDGVEVVVVAEVVVM